MQIERVGAAIQSPQCFLSGSEVLGEGKRVAIFLGRRAGVALLFQETPQQAMRFESGSILDSFTGKVAAEQIGGVR